MDDKIAILGLVEIASALSCGLVILFLTYKVVSMYGQKKLGMEKPNTAYNILMAGVLFSVGYIVSGVITPILDSFRILLNTDISVMSLFGQFLLYGGIYILIACICALIVIILGAFMYDSMTVLDEKEELRNNNIGVAIVLVAIIATLSLMTSEGITLLIESFIPYPDFEPNLK